MASMVSRRDWLLSAAALAAAPALRAPRAAAQGRTKIVEAHTGTLFMAPVYIAEAAGYFAEEGIDLELTEVESGALGIATLVSGQSQVFDADPFQAVQLRAQGKPIVFIYNLTKRVTLDMVARPDVVQERNLSRNRPVDERLKGLKGLKLGITRPGAATDVYMRYYLKRAGLDPDRDAQLIAIGGGSSLLAALRTKQIDAFHLSAPTPYLAARDGFGEVVVKASAGDVPELDDFFYTGIAVTKPYAEKNAETLRRWVRAVNKAQGLMRRDQQAAVTHLRKHFPRMEPDVLALAMKEILPALSEDGVMTEAMVRKHLDFLAKTGQTQGTAPSSEGELWTNSFVKK
jgi:NitT/TauT family transport system substrate-binding protein